MDDLLARTASVSQQQADWLAVLLETHWLKGTQLLLASEEADPEDPWGGALSAYIFHCWWAGVRLSHTHSLTG